MDVIDWLKSEKIEVMSNACVGAYILLLCEAWTRPLCSLPSATLALKKLARWDGTDEEFEPVLQCFENLKGQARVVNPRLKREWDTTQARLLALSEAGKRGAQLKQERKEIQRKPRVPRANNPPSTDFEAFWEAYPKKEGKKAAYKAFEAAHDKPDITTLVAVIVRSANTEDWTKLQGKYIPQPARWLNEGRWTDQPMTGNGSTQRPPPPPPKTDPIGRGLWGRTYGDPRSHGYD